jgi:putative CocE/NonD family hydrolase
LSHLDFVLRVEVDEIRKVATRMSMSARHVPVPRGRSRVERAVDAVVSRLLHLPRARSGYALTQGVRVPMRDGVHLLADHFAPTGRASGTVLIRTPYGADLASRALLGSPFAQRGYHVVMAHCRGRFGSGGTFEPFRTEIEDAADTVQWLRGQPWFEGRFATYGGSYLSFTQWALLMDPPPELATAVIQVSLHDFSEAFRPEGALAIEAWLTFAEIVADEPSLATMFWHDLTAVRRHRPALGRLPAARAAEALVGGRASWFREYASRPVSDEEFWSKMRLGPALERTQVPVLLQTGWQDLFLRQTLDQYRNLQRRGVEVGLTVGPWTHASFDVVGGGGAVIYPEALAWLDEHLARAGARARPAPVRICVTGADEWRCLDSWPPDTRDSVLYLLPHGGLGPRPAPSGRHAERFTYDPSDPTPSIGGRMLSGNKTGYRDDTSLTARSDVLTFTGPALRAPVDVVGVPTVELVHASDNPNADLFVRISDVDETGRSRNVSDGFVRLDDASPLPRTVRIEMDATAHRFAPGHQICLRVAGGSFPYRSRNLGTRDHDTSSDLTPSRRAVTLTGSQIHLPSTRPMSEVIHADTLNPDG